MWRQPSYFVSFYDDKRSGLDRNATFETLTLSSWEVSIFEAPMTKPCPHVARQRAHGASPSFLVAASSDAFETALHQPHMLRSPLICFPRGSRSAVLSRVPLPFLFTLHATLRAARLRHRRSSCRHQPLLSTVVNVTPRRPNFS